MHLWCLNRIQSEDGQEYDVVVCFSLDKKSFGEESNRDIEADEIIDAADADVDGVKIEFRLHNFKDK